MADYDIVYGYRVERKPYLRPDHEYTWRKKTDYIVIHCSATVASQDIGAEEIREWHVNERGFLDIGYHFVIRRDGTIERGRPANAKGAHTEGFNSTSLGICLVGGADSRGRGENNFTQPQWDTLNFLVDEALKAYPTAKVMGHRDFPNVKKDCPSFDVRKWFMSRPYVQLKLPIEGEESATGGLFQ